MKILFIYPRYLKLVEGHDRLEDLTHGYPWLDPVGPSLALPILAALTPSDVELEYVDDQFQKIPYGAEADAVAITLFTPQATRAYEIADAFRARGRHVVLGGKHVTIFPEEAALHADTIVIGEAEYAWPRLVSDLKAGRVAARYTSESAPIARDIPIPKRDIVDRSNYPHDMELFHNPRGCRFQCQWCPIPGLEPLEDGKQRTWSLAVMLDDLAGIKSKMIYIADNLTQGATRAGELNAVRELFAAIRESGKRFMLAMSPDEIEGMLLEDPQLMPYLHACGVDSIYLVQNAFVANVPSSFVKRYWQNDDVIKRLQDMGFHISSSVMMGWDYDDEGIFDTACNYLERLSIDDAIFFIATPFPGSRMFDRLNRQGRILTYEWQRYNGAHAVFKPQNMTPERLYEGWLACWSWFLSTHIDDVRNRYAK